MTDEGQWIRAKAASRLLGGTLPDDEDTSRRLRQPLELGAVKSHARIGRISHKGTTEELRDFPVPKWLWEDPTNRNSFFSLSEDTYSRSLSASDTRPFQWMGKTYWGTVRVEVFGLQFDEAAFMEYFDLGPDASNDAAPAHPVAPAPATSGTEESDSNSGARPNAENWAKYLAAFAAVAEEFQVGADEPESKIHERVAVFLQGRGHKCLHVDTARPAIKRAKTWLNGRDLPDDNRDTPPE